MTVLHVPNNSIGAPQGTHLVDWEATVYTVYLFVEHGFVCTKQKSRLEKPNKNYKIKRLE
jgi:hypothetical protein